AELAHDYGAALVLLHAGESLGPEQATYGEAASLAHPEAAVRQRLWEHLRRARPGGAQLQVEYVLSEEDPVTAILRTAAAWGCDPIVLGTHGLTGWRRWVAGSVAEEVVRRAPCSVLVVKPAGAAPALPPLHPTALHPGYLKEKEEPGSSAGEPFRAGP